jgi:AcrR family transcriptional regulator
MRARSAKRVKRLTRAESQAATRVALLNSAEELFTRFGYEATTIEAITETAGFSRGAFYSNFASKDELFLSLVESRIADIFEQIALAFQEGQTEAERIRSGGAFLDSLLERDRQWCLLYMEFWSRAVRDPKLRRRFARQYELQRDGIAQMIEARYAELGLEVDAPARELASTLVALFEGHVLQRLIDPRAFDEGFFTRLLLRFFARLDAANNATRPAGRAAGSR